MSTKGFGSTGFIEDGVGERRVRKVRHMVVRVENKEEDPPTSIIYKRKFTKTVYGEPSGTVRTFSGLYSVYFTSVRGLGQGVNR